MATLLSDRSDVIVSVTEPFDGHPEEQSHERLISTTQAGDNVVTSRHGVGSLVWGADLVGLAAALAGTLDAPTLLAVADGTVDHVSAASAPVRFPEPVGTRVAHERASPVSGTKLLRADGVAEWSALRVTGERTLAMVDDAQFAAAAILAAAASLPAGPVWDQREEFLEEVRRLGLRFAQAVA